MPEMWVPSPSREDPLEKEMATHSSILAQKNSCLCPTDTGAWRATVHGVAESQTQTSTQWLVTVHRLRLWMCIDVYVFTRLYFLFHFNMSWLQILVSTVVWLIIQWHWVYPYCYATVTTTYLQNFHLSQSIVRFSALLTSSLCMSLFCTSTWII